MCRFAARVVAFLDRDDELAFLPLRDPVAEPLLARLPHEERFATWYLAQPGGSIVGYGTGGVQLLEAMRLTRRAGHALARVPAGLLDGAYSVIAGRRSALGRLVPDRPGPRRFP